MIQVTIPEINLSELRIRIAEAAKKFKLEYTLTLSPRKELWEETLIDGEKITIYGNDVTINFPEIEKFTETGFEYLGCIKKDVILTLHPNSDFSLSTLKDEIETFPCHDCGKRIQRKIIHAFREVATDKVKVFGSGCAVKRFGIDIEKLIRKFENLKCLVDDFASGEGRSIRYISGIIWCTLAYHSIRKYGYTSGTKAQENWTASTRDITSTAYTKLIIAGEDDSKKEYKQDLIDYPFNYSEFMDWAEVFSQSMDDNDFGNNMREVVALLHDSGIAHERMLGYIAYLVFKYWYENIKVKPEPVSYNEDYSDYEIGDGIKNLKVKKVGEYTFAGYYGPTTIYTFRGIEDNRKYKWFASKDLDGDIFLITSCKIKDIENHPKYGKAVMITRCRTKELN